IDAAANQLMAERPIAAGDFAAAPPIHFPPLPVADLTLPVTLIRTQQLLPESADRRQVHDEVRRGWVDEQTPPTTPPPLPPALALPAFSAPDKIEKAIPALLADSGRPETLLYRRPGFRDDPRHFFDLVAYAPGLNTSYADVEAALEAEALPNPRLRTGKID